MPAPLAALLERGASEAEIVERGGALLHRLLSRDDRLPAGCAEPDPARYRPYLLYRDPAARFAVVGFVRGARPHTIWGLVGIARGAGGVQDYRVQPGGAPARRRHGGRRVARAGRRAPGAQRLCRPRPDRHPCLRRRHRRHRARHLFPGRRRDAVPLRPRQRRYPISALTGHDSHPLRRYRDVPIVVPDDGEGLAHPAVRRLAAFGCTDVALLDGGVAGRAADGASCPAT